MKALKEPEKPWPPSSYEYEEKTERKYIYSWYQSAREDDWGDDDEEIEDWKTNQAEPLHEMDLLSLASRARDMGVKMEDVKIELGEDSSCMSFDGYYVRFYYEVKIPARKAELADALKKYRADLVQYERDMDEYKAACHLKEIKDTEAKLKKLKKGK